MPTPLDHTAGDRISVTVGGVANDTWTGWRVESDLLTPADAFELELYTRDRVSLPTDVAEGAPCRLALGSDVVLTGRLDDVEHEVSRGGHVVRLTGRDLAGGLVDCSTPFVSLREASLKQIVDQVVRPMGIAKVRLQADKPATRRRIQVQPGQSAWEALQQLAEANGLWPWMEPDGTLVVGGPDYTAAPVGTLTLRVDGRGNNVERLNLRRSIANRYSEVVVLGQHGAFGGGQWLTDRTALKARQVDSALQQRGIYRPRVVVDASCDSGDLATARARKLLADSQLSGVELRAQVAGWRATGGAVWTPGQRVQVQSEPHNLDSTYFIMARTLRLDRRSGAVTELSLREDKRWILGNRARKPRQVKTAAAKVPQ